MPHPASIITLLTDFGDRDWFVASMKGVILSINPQATIIDLTHHIGSHDVWDGAYAWKSCYKYFPEGTIHVAVVDPGVGTDRRPLIAKSSRYFFCAPGGVALQAAAVRVLWTRRLGCPPLSGDSTAVGADGTGGGGRLRRCLR